MSTQPKNMSTQRKTIVTIREQKGKTPIVCLTAYTAPMAKILDPHVDVLLVGDTLGMVVHGLDSTLGVTVEMMKLHGGAVCRASKTACVVVDLPFGSYQASPQDAFRHAADIMQHTGCAAVKLEGGSEMAETVNFLVKRGIPVMGHIGLMPQHLHTMGGFRFQGRSDAQLEAIIADAKAIEAAGAFAVVIEGVAEPLAQRITETLTVPTIGIGASVTCDGQVLVVDDMLGLFDEFTPKFVKKYGNLNAVIDEAVQQYAEEVRSRHFPEPKHCYLSK